MFVGPFIVGVFAALTPASARYSPQSIVRTGAHQQVAPDLAGPPLRVLVPAYFYPIPGSPWVRLTAAAAANPRRIVAIGNPSNGPGSSVDSNYTAAFQSFRNTGGTLLGYVYTSYGARPIATVLSEIDAWFNMYSADGIFVDEMDNTPGAHESYYRAIYTHVQARPMRPFIVGNPGASTTPSYLLLNGQPVVSALCIFETGTGFTSWTSDAWTASHARSHFYALPYATPASGWQAAVDHAFAQNCGFVYVTDDTLPNPWDTLPSYFESMVGYVIATY
jgi:hypothetical protein